MPGRSRSKNGVASLAYVPGIPANMARRRTIDRDGRNKSGHDNRVRGAAQGNSWP
jgi:hypothetical protein